MKQNRCKQCKEKNKNKSDLTADKIDKIDQLSRGMIDSKLSEPKEVVTTVTVQRDVLYLRFLVVRIWVRFCIIWFDQMRMDPIISIPIHSKSLHRILASYNRICLLCVTETHHCVTLYIHFHRSSPTPTRTYNASVGIFLDRIIYTLSSVISDTHNRTCIYLCR